VFQISAVFHFHLPTSVFHLALFPLLPLEA
jgi:hypothetical protein